MSGASVSVHPVTSSAAHAGTAPALVSERSDPAAAPVRPNEALFQGAYPVFDSLARYLSCYRQDPLAYSTTEWVDWLCETIEKARKRDNLVTARAFGDELGELIEPDPDSFSFQFLDRCRIASHLLGSRESSMVSLLGQPSVQAQLLAQVGEAYEQGMAAQARQAEPVRTLSVLSDIIMTLRGRDPMGASSTDYCFRNEADDGLMEVAAEVLAKEIERNPAETAKRISDAPEIHVLLYPKPLGRLCEHLPDKCNREVLLSFVKELRNHTGQNVSSFPHWTEKELKPDDRRRRGLDLVIRDLEKTGKLSEYLPDPFGCQTGRKFLPWAPVLVKSLSEGALCSLLADKEAPPRLLEGMLSQPNFPIERSLSCSRV